MTPLAAIALGSMAMTPLAHAVQDAVDALHADLLAGPTATSVLERRCGGLAVRAEVDRGIDVPASAEQRDRLAVSADEPLGYRRVRLVCGARLLSEAENWFVPERLTPEMRAALAESDTPFGAVIADLVPVRCNLAAERLWDGRGAPPVAVLRHRALVSSGAGVPLAEVVETYQRALVLP